MGGWFKMKMYGCILSGGCGILFGMSISMKYQRMHRCMKGDLCNGPQTLISSLKFADNYANDDAKDCEDDAEDSEDDIDFVVSIERATLYWCCGHHGGLVFAGSSTGGIQSMKRWSGPLTAQDKLLCR